MKNMKQKNIDNSARIYYQGNPGSYMNIASLEIEKGLNVEITEIKGKPEFIDVWKSIGKESIGVLAIENSYMGSIHPNLYAFLRYDYKIIGEYYLPINHCLCSKETDIKKIKKAYSQLPALDQCYNYLKEKNIFPVAFSDTALSAKYISETDEKGLGAICSERAAKIYNLNILEKNIQDQQGNNTRFAIIVPKENGIEYNLKSNKVSILFEAKNIPASLYKCLGAFATNNVNLTKIESLPSGSGYFSYYFWLDFKGSLKDENVKKALEELKFFTSSLKVLGEY
ncbi:hypothetical protein CSA08_01665 [Candidatus Gracilibacteria bacterium]|nr:MAG: hypothetical protein CSA08_01665 [Candidatus Gracilibacteria bacterium]